MSDILVNNLILKLKLKHFIGLPYTGFANTHANIEHWGKIIKKKTKKTTQLSTDRGQDIFQYSNDFFDSIISWVTHENHLWGKQYIFSWALLYSGFYI